MKRSSPLPSARSLAWLVCAALAALAIPASCSKFEAASRLEEDAAPDASTPPSAPSLGLDVLGATLEPAFSPDHFEYQALCPWSALGHYVKIVATFPDPNGSATLRRGDGTMSTLRAEVPEELELTSGKQELLSIVANAPDGVPRVYLITLTAPEAQVDWLKADPAHVDARLTQEPQALSVSDDGALIAVGSALDDPGADGGVTRGALTLFARDGMSWSQSGRVQGEAGARLGLAVAMAPGVLAVGAGNATVQVYSLREQEQPLGAPFRIAGTAADTFGSALAFVDAQTLLIGSRSASLVLPAPPPADAGPDAGPGSTSLLRSGLVTVFHREPLRDGESAWAAGARVEHPGQRAEARFGQVIVSDGESVVIAAPYDNLGEGLVAAGSVSVYRASDLANASASADVQPVATLQDPEPQANAVFGASVAVQGDLILVGAPWADQRAGRAYVFRRDQNGYVLEQRLHIDSSPQDQYGYALGLRGGVAFVGAPLEDGSTNASLRTPDDQVTNSGVVYSFERQPDRRWLSRGYLKVPRGAGGQQFGQALQPLGASFVASAPGDSQTADGGAILRSGALILLR